MKTFKENLIKADGLSLTEGSNLFNTNKVTVINATEHNAVCKVIDNKSYEVSLSFNSEKTLINHICSCGNPRICEHVVAAIHAVDEFRADKRDIKSLNLDEITTSFIETISPTRVITIQEYFVKFLKTYGDKNFASFCSMVLDKLISDRNLIHKYLTFLYQFDYFISRKALKVSFDDIFKNFLTSFDFEKLSDKYCLENIRRLINFSQNITTSIIKVLFNILEKNPDVFDKYSQIISTLTSITYEWIHYLTPNTFKLMIPTIEKEDLYDSLSYQALDYYLNNHITIDTLEPFLEKPILDFERDYEFGFSYEFITECIKKRKYEPIVYFLNNLKTKEPISIIMDLLNLKDFYNYLKENDKLELLKTDIRIAIELEGMSDLHDFVPPHEINITLLFILIKAGYFTLSNHKISDFELIFAGKEKVHFLRILENYVSNTLISKDLLSQILNNKEINDFIHEVYYENFSLINKLLEKSNGVEGFNFINLEGK